MNDLVEQETVMDINVEKENYFTIGQVRAYCRRRGYPITKQGIYYMGRKYGFMIGEDPPYLFIRAGVKDWIRSLSKKPPIGWERPSVLAEKLGIAKQNIYWWIYTRRLEPMIIGSGKGVMYVDCEQVNSLVSTGRGTGKLCTRPEAGEGENDGK